MDKILDIETSLNISSVIENGADAIRNLTEMNLGLLHLMRIFACDVSRCAETIRLLYLADSSELLLPENHEILHARELEWFPESVREISRYGYHPGLFFLGSYTIGRSVAHGEYVEENEVEIFVTACEIIVDSIASSLPLGDNYT